MTTVVTDEPLSEANRKERIALLRREARYGKLWFADHLFWAADELERMSTASPPETNDVERLIARMIEIADRDDTTGLAADALREGSETIERLQALSKDEGLRSALEPFAKLPFEGTIWEGEHEPDDSIVFFNVETGAKITLGDFRRARQALSPEMKE